MNTTDEILTGIGVLLFAIFVMLWALLMIALTMADKSTYTAQKIMVASLPIALLGIAWVFVRGR